MMSKLVALTTATLVALLIVLGGTALARDRNNDRIPDRWEKNNGLSLKVKQTRRDQDRDGLKNINEWRSHTDPTDADSDDDGAADGEEDFDRDHVDNDNEQDESTNPGDRDTDDDGKPDGREDADHDHLNNADEEQAADQPDDPDTDDDGIEDGEENAGVIASFDAETGLLTINVFQGDTVSGRVTDSTEISCETEDEHEDLDEAGGNDDKRAMHDEVDDEDGPGDDEVGDEDGPGDDEVGDDEDEPGEEHGDEDNVCTTADLVPGTNVHEAELEGSVFEEIELVR